MIEVVRNLNVSYESHKDAVVEQVVAKVVHIAANNLLALKNFDSLGVDHFTCSKDRCMSGLISGVEVGSLVGCLVCFDTRVTPVPFGIAERLHPLA